MVNRVTDTRSINGRSLISANGIGMPVRTPLTTSCGPNPNSTKTRLVTAAARAATDRRVSTTPSTRTSSSGTPKNEFSSVVALLSRAAITGSPASDSRA